MNPNSLSLPDFIELLAREGVTDPGIFSYLSTTDVRRLSEWLKRLEHVREIQTKGKKKQAQRSRLLGKILEKAARVLLDGCKCLTHDGNLRTTTSEIDFLIRIGPLGGAIPLLREADTHAIGEAKCYATGPKTEWVNEFIGILQSHSAKLGILFTACPPRTLRSEIRTSIAIHAATGKYVVPFGLSQFGRICAGDNFLAVLSEQAVNSRVHSISLQI